MSSRRLLKRLRALRQALRDPDDVNQCAMHLDIQFFDGINGPVWYLQGHFLSGSETMQFGGRGTLGGALDQAESFARADEEHRFLHKLAPHPVSPDGSQAT